MKKSILFTPKGLMALALLVLVGYAIFAVQTGKVDVGNTFSDLGGNDDVEDLTGTFDLKIHDGVTKNATATISSEDYYNDDDTALTIYSADANVDDGLEIMFNITAQRQYVKEAANLVVECKFPDKEISGVTADNLVEKTNGKVDADINDGGKHSDDNTVYLRIPMAAGTASVDIEVAFDQEETWHDGMTDMSTYFDAVCSVSNEDGSQSSEVRAKIFANN